MRMQTFAIVVSMVVIITKVILLVRIIVASFIFMKEIQGMEIGTETVIRIAEMIILNIAIIMHNHNKTSVVSVILMIRTTFAYSRVGDYIFLS